MQSPTPKARRDEVRYLSGPGIPCSDVLPLLMEQILPSVLAVKDVLFHVLMLPTWSEPSGSASSAPTPRAALPPNCWINCEEDRTLGGCASRDTP
jgi:hypothetical protein